MSGKTEGVDDSIVCIDVGIRNLGVCQGRPIRSATDGSLERIELLAWDDVNLVHLSPAAQAIDDEIADGAKHCQFHLPRAHRACGKKPAWTDGKTAFFCAQHAVGQQCPLALTEAGKPVARCPSVDALRAYCMEQGYAGVTKASLKRDLLVEITKCSLLPLSWFGQAFAKTVAPKGSIAFKLPLAVFHDMARAFVAKYPAFAKAGKVRLESQDVRDHKGQPVALHMKRLELYLFSEIRNASLAEGRELDIETVHAQAKTVGLGAVKRARGKSGYSPRKEDAKALTLKNAQLYQIGADWLRVYESAPTQADMADAFCMLVKQCNTPSDKDEGPGDVI
jgi:hypothetical protein